MENLSEKEMLIKQQLKLGFDEVDVTAVEGEHGAFTGFITQEGVKTDTDGSKYVSVVDQDNDCFDVDIQYIDFA